MKKVLLYVFLGIGVLALLACLFSSLTTSTTENEGNGRFFIVYDNVLDLVERVATIFDSVRGFIIQVIDFIVNLITEISQFFDIVWIKFCEFFGIDISTEVSNLTYQIGDIKC